MFALLDRDGDKNLTKLELTAFYEDMNTDNNQVVITEEIFSWINKNLDSICNEHRTMIDEDLKFGDRAKAVKSKAVHDLYMDILDKNSDSKVDKNDT